MKQFWIAVIFCAALAGVVGGCGAAHTPPSPQVVLPPPPAPPASPEVALRERVTAFWQARLNDDAVRQYDFMEPDAKGRVPLTAFVRSQGTFQFQSYEVRSINIVGEKAWAKIQYTFKMRVPQLANFGPWTQESFEIWTLRDGVWVRPYRQEGAQTPPPGTSRLHRSDFA